MQVADKQHNLNLTPLGAGDLIDRAVRFYRGNFWTFVLIAAPPVVVGTLISVVWTVAGRSLFNVGGGRYGEATLYYVFLWFGNFVIWLTETVATIVVMGGASRNFVRHLLFGEPITFRETYKNTFKRVFGLIAASTMITILLGAVGSVIGYLGLIVAILLVMLAAYVFSFLPVLSVIVSIIAVAAATFGTLWLFFLLASRFVYVPQVMLVEGQGVFASIGRSASLAGGNVSRLAALFIFTIVAAYSALALLYVPLAWLAWANGVDFFSFDADLVPAWYQIANQVVSQTSLILLTPIWMIGLCLLYVDERVRHEGYDIELMAARRLGEIPAVPQSYVNPLQPALAQTNAAAAPVVSQPKKKLTTLGLE